MQIVAANKEARKADAILDCDGDTFLKNECKADKWLIIELSQVIKPTILVLSQVSVVGVFPSLGLVLFNLPIARVCFV